MDLRAPAPGLRWPKRLASLAAVVVLWACLWLAAASASALQQPAVIATLVTLVAGGAAAIGSRMQRRHTRSARDELNDERARATQLQEADDLKNTFLSAVSHEIRTPLTSILGFSITLLDRRELSDAARERILRTMVSEAEHLEDILANLLDLDRLTRGKAALVPVDADVARITRQAVAKIELRTGRSVQVDAPDQLRVVLDASKVERIIENLVGNAVKYTPPDAEIAVSLRAGRRGISIRVDDSGPGIACELRETIFEPFRRGTSVGVPGTGVGLSLVDSFSRMHGGRAWVEERPGGGCRFQVHLPVQSASGAAASEPHGGGGQMSVAVSLGGSAHAPEV